MTLQMLLDNESITKYQLSKISGVPKTTIIDICSGKSSIQKCSAKTVQMIAKALNRSMEDIMELDDDGYNAETGMITFKGDSKEFSYKYSLDETGSYKMDVNVTVVQKTAEEEAAEKEEAKKLEEEKELLFNAI